MKLSQIRYFCTVCEYGSITAAAEALHISQPSVSSAIKELELEFGVNLFYRKNKSITLTQEGSFFLRKISGLIKELDSVEQQMRDFGNKNNQIRIAIPPIIEAVLFPDVFSRFHRLYPEINIEIVDAGSMQTWQLVDDDTLDVAIALIDNNIRNKFSVIPLLETDFRFCVSKKHPLASSPSVTIEQIKDEPLLTFNSDAMGGHLVTNLFAQKGLKPNIIMRSNQLFTLVEFINCAVAASFLFREVADLCHNFVAIPIEETPKITIGLIYKHNKILYNDYLKFIKFMKSYTYTPRELY